jgi:flagellar M-ring protein FliF
VLAGELAGVIPSLPGRRSARLHLVLPGREVLGRQRFTPNARVRELADARPAPAARGQVQPVQHLAAAAEPSWSLEGVVLIDGRGTLLARGAEGAPDA